jgi:adenylate cyclase
MALEVERKFLVTGEGWRAGVRHERRLRQGYLARATRSSVRIRTDGERAHLNIKAAVPGASRAEYEYEVPLADGREMLETLCVGGIVEKTRFEVAHEGRCWEVDVFEGANAGLVVAELELADAQESFVRPAWLGREVTDELRYYNNQLAERPYRTWVDRD